MPGVWIYEVKQCFLLLFFKKKMEILLNFYLTIFIVKSLQKEQNSTNLLLWPPICRNKPAITQKWFNFLDTNSTEKLNWKSEITCKKISPFLLAISFIQNQLFILSWTSVVFSEMEKFLPLDFPFWHNIYCPHCNNMYKLDSKPENKTKRVETEIVITK